MSAWSTKGVPGQPRLLHSETLSQNNKTKTKIKTKKKKKPKNPSPFLTILKLGTTGHTCHPSIWEAEAGRWSDLGLCIKH
jgi:hypothetical protein